MKMVFRVLFNFKQILTLKISFRSLICSQFLIILLICSFFRICLSSFHYRFCFIFYFVIHFILLQFSSVFLSSRILHVFSLFSFTFIALSFFVSFPLSVVHSVLFYFLYFLLQFPFLLLLYS